MTGTRRDLFRWTTLGLGSLATTGLAANSAEACCKGRYLGVPVAGGPIVRPGYGSPTINITSLTSGTNVQRTFTVYGDFSTGGGAAAGTTVSCSVFPPLSSTACTSSTAYVSESFLTWHADITIPSPSSTGGVSGGTSGLSLVAQVTVPGTGTSFATVTDITLDDDPSTNPPPPIITIGSPGYRDPRVTAAIGATPQPDGLLYDGTIDVVYTVYVSQGKVLGNHRKAVLTPMGNHRKWQPNAHNIGTPSDPNHISLVVTGMGMNPANGKVRVITTSRPGLVFAKA